MCAASIPLDDRSKPPEDDLKDLTTFDSDGTGDHKINKRLSDIGADRAFALKEQQIEESLENQENKRHSDTDTDTNFDLEFYNGNSYRFVRDTTKDKLLTVRIARNTPDTNKPIPQPLKTMTIA